MVIKTKMRTNDFLKLWTVNFQFVFSSRFVIRIRKTFLASFALTYRVRHGHWFLLTWVGSFVFWGFIQKVTLILENIKIISTWSVFLSQQLSSSLKQWNQSGGLLNCFQSNCPALSLSCSFCHSVSFPPFTCKLNWAWLSFFIFFSNNFSCWVSLRGFIHSYKKNKVAEIDLFLLQMIFFCVGWFVFFFIFVFACCFFSPYHFSCFGKEKI